jgi:tetratricopeptide (TPR) repeat protein
MLNRKKIAALGLVFAMALAACGHSQVQPAERADLEKSLTFSLEATRNDGSPAFPHNAEADVMRLLELDRDEIDYGKTIEHAGNLVEILEKSGRQDDANKLLAEMKKFFEWNSERERGKKETEDEHVDLAEAHLRKAIETAEHLDAMLFAKNSPNLIEDYNALAEVLQKQKKSSEAEQLYRKALSATFRTQGKTSEPAARAQLCLARFYKETNQPHKALSNLDQMIKKFPHNVEARQVRAELHSSMGEHENAIKDVDEILKLQPQNEWAKNKLKELSSHRPRHRQAAQIEPWTSSIFRGSTRSSNNGLVLFDDAG